MRQTDLRTLATRGIEVIRSLKMRGLEVYEALDGEGSKMLIFRGGVVGPSWVSIGFLLEKCAIQHCILTLGRPYFMASDSRELRQFFGEIVSASKRSFREEVFVPGVGFMFSELRKKFDPRVLIAPALILGVTVVVSIFQVSKPEAELQSVEPPRIVTCALDLNEGEFHLWLRDKLVAADFSSGEITIQTELGTVSVRVAQALGSTQLIHGTLNCEDGRIQKLKFRTDSQSGGGLVELGKELDS